MKKRTMALLVSVCMLLVLATPAAALAGSVRISGEQADGTLTVTVSIHDIKLNVMELYLAYDAERLSPVENAGTILKPLQAEYDAWTGEGWMQANAAIDEENGVIRCLVMADPDARGEGTLDEEGYLSVGGTPMELFSIAFTVREGAEVYADSVHLGLSSSAPTGIVIADGTEHGQTAASLAEVDLGTNAKTPGGVPEGYFGGRPAVEEPGRSEGSGAPGNTGTAGSGGAPGNSGGTPTTPAPDAAFSDITAHWAKASIEKLVAAGAISGYADGTFRPNAFLTRGEFCTVLTRYFGLTPDVGNASVFTDASSHWSAGYVGAVYKAGLVSGIGDDKFAPDAPITREAMVTILARATGVTGGTLNFTDSAGISTWAAPYVAAAVQSGLISGYPDGSFRPQNDVTRGEMSAVMAQITPSLRDSAK